MRIFYKYSFDPIKYFYVNRECSIKEALLENIKDQEIIENAEKYEVIKDHFIALKNNDLNKKISNDIYIQLTPKGEGSLGRALQGAGTGAGIGAGIGSGAAGVGALPGAVLGGLVGFTAGFIGGVIEQTFTDEASQALEKKQNQSNQSDQLKLYDLTMYDLRKRVTREIPDKLKSKTLDPVLSSNKVSPNSIIPEVFGEFRFRPYQITALKRENILEERNRKFRKRYYYNSVYSGGEGKIELSDPYFMDRPAQDTEYTRSRFNYTTGSIDSNITSLFNIEDGSDLVSTTLSIADLDINNFTTEEIGISRDVFYSTRDIAGFKGQYIRDSLCRSISLDLVISSRNVTGSVSSNWRDLFYKLSKRYIPGSKITVGQYRDRSNQNVLGFATSPATGSLPGASRANVTAITRTVISSTSSEYKLLYTGSKNLSKINFVYDFLNSLNKLEINNNLIIGPSITANRITAGTYRFSSGGLEGSAEPDISNNISTIESTSGHVQIEGFDNIFNDLTEVYINQTTYYPGDPTQLNAGLSRIILYTNSSKTIRATNAFTTTPFTLNGKYSNGNTMLWDGVYGNTRSFPSTSNLNNTLRILIGETEGCDFLKNYHGKDIYYNLENVDQNSFVENLGNNICNIKSANYNPSGRSYSTSVTFVTVSKPFRLWELNPPEDSSGNALIVANVNYTTLPTDTVTGKPEQYTSSSAINSVLYMLAGRLLGNSQCSFLRTYNDKIYYKVSNLGEQFSFDTETVCGFTSSQVGGGGGGQSDEDEESGPSGQQNPQASCSDITNVSRAEDNIFQGFGSGTGGNPVTSGTTVTIDWDYRPGKNPESLAICVNGVSVATSGTSVSHTYNTVGTTIVKFIARIGSVVDVRTERVRVTASTTVTSTLTASNTSPNVNQSITLTFNSTNAQSGRLRESGSSSNLTIGTTGTFNRSKNSAGSFTYTYEAFSGLNFTGTKHTSTVTVTWGVSQVIPTARLTASNINPRIGQTVILTFNSTNAQSGRLRISGADTNIDEGTTGSEPVTRSTAGSTTYTYTAFSGANYTGQSASSSITITWRTQTVLATGHQAQRIDEILFKDNNGRTKHYKYNIQGNTYVSQTNNVLEYSLTSSVDALSRANVNYMTLPTATVTGKPEQYTSSSAINSVLYMLAGRLLGNSQCTYLRTYNGAIDYKEINLEDQTTFESETVCGFTSSSVMSSERNFLIGAQFVRLSNGYYTYSKNPPFSPARGTELTSPSNPYIVQMTYTPTSIFQFDIANTYSKYDQLQRVNVLGRIVNLNKESSDKTFNGVTFRRYTTSSLPGYSTLIIKSTTGGQFTFYDTASGNVPAKIGTTLNPQSAKRLDEIRFTDNNGVQRYYKYNAQSSTYVLQTSTTRTTGSIINPLPTGLTGIFVDNGNLLFESNQSNYFGTYPLNWAKIIREGGTYDWYFRSVRRQGSYYYNYVYGGASDRTPINNWDQTINPFSFDIELGNGTRLQVIPASSFESTGRRVSEFVIEKNGLNTHYKYNASTEDYDLQSTIPDNLIPRNLTTIVGGYSFTVDTNKYLEILFKNGNIIPFYIEDDGGEYLEFEQTTVPIVNDVTQAQFNLQSYGTANYSSYTRVVYDKDDTGTVTGNYFAFTSNSSIQKVLGMLLGKTEGCTFATNYDGNAIYYKTADIGERSNFATETVCGFASTASTGTSQSALSMREMIIYGVNGPKRYLINNIAGNITGTDDPDISYTSKLLTTYKRNISSLNYPNKLPAETPWYPLHIQFFPDSKLLARASNRTIEKIRLRKQFTYNGRLTTGPAWSEIESTHYNQDSALNEYGGGFIFMEYAYVGLNTANAIFNLVGNRTGSVYQLQVQIAGDLLLSWFNITTESLWNSFLTKTTPDNLIFQFDNADGSSRQRITVPIVNSFYLGTEKAIYNNLTDNLFGRAGATYNTDYEEVKGKSIYLVGQTMTRYAKTHEEAQGIPNAVIHDFTNNTLTIYKNSVNVRNRLALTNINVATTGTETNSGPPVPKSLNFTPSSHTKSYSSQDQGLDPVMYGSNYRLNIALSGNEFNRLVGQRRGGGLFGASEYYNLATFRADGTRDRNIPRSANIRNESFWNDLRTSHGGWIQYAREPDNWSPPINTSNISSNDTKGTFIYNKEGSVFNGMEITYVLRGIYYINYQFNPAMTLPPDFSNETRNFQGFFVHLDFFYTNRRGETYLTNGPMDVDFGNSDINTQRFANSSDYNYNRNEDFIVKHIVVNNQILDTTISADYTLDYSSRRRETNAIIDNCLYIGNLVNSRNPVEGIDNTFLYNLFNKTNTNEFSINLNIQLANNEYLFGNRRTGSVDDDPDDDSGNGDGNGNGNGNGDGTPDTGTITVTRTGDLAPITDNTVGRVAVNQTGYDNQESLNSEITAGIVTSKPFQQTNTIAGKLFLYEPTNNLPIYFLKMIGSSLQRPGNSNLESIFAERNFIIGADETGYYLYPRFDVLSSNQISVTSLNQFNIILRTTQLTNFSNDRIRNLEIHRVPYPAILGTNKDLTGIEYAIDLPSNSSLETYIYPQSIVITPNADILPVKREGLINYELRVSLPQPPDPEDYDWPDAPRLPKGNNIDIPVNESRKVRCRVYRGVGLGCRRETILEGKYDTSKHLNKVIEWENEWNHINLIYSGDIEQYQKDVQDFDRELSEVLQGISEFTILGKRFLIDTSAGLDGDRFHSRNPSRICLHILYEYFLRIKKYNTFTQMVDTQSFNDWARFCETNSFTFDGVIDFETSVFSTLESIAKLGRALIVIQRDKIKVVFAKRQTVPKQYISANNIINFQSTVQKVNLPDAIRGTYFNKESLYKPDEILEYSNALFQSNIDLREIDFFGLTSETDVRRQIQYIFRTTRLELETFNITTGVENIVSELGDLIALHYNEIDTTMLQTKFLQPKKDASGNVIGFLTEESVLPTLDLTKDYVMKLFKSDGTIIDHEILSFAIENILTDEDGINTRKQQLIRNYDGTPIRKRPRNRMILNLKTAERYTSQTFIDSGIARGNLILIGEANNITKYCLIKEISYNPDLTCNLKLVEYNDELYSDLISNQ